MRHLTAVCLSVALFAEVAGLLLVLPSPVHADADLTFLQYTTDGATIDDAHTFTDQNFGIPASDRIIFVIINAEDTGGGLSTIQSMTIGGVSADVDALLVDTGNGDFAAIAWAAVPLGANGTVFVDTNSNNRMSIAVYRATGLGTSITPTDTATNADDVVSMSIDVPEGGILLAGASFADAETAVTTTGVTEDYDQAIDELGDWSAGGSASGLTAESNRTVSFNGGAGDAAGVAVSYAPGAEVAGVLSRPPNNLGLVGYWSFDEGRGTLATDFSGRGNNGTLNGATWTAGKRGAALSVDGTDDDVDAGTPTNLGLSGNQAFTIAAWINPTATRNDGSFFSYGDAGSGRVISLNSDTSGNIYSVHFSNDHSFSRDFELGRWQHVVITYDGTTERLYYDGEYTGESWNPSSLNLVAGDQMYIGRASWNGIYAHTAAIDDVRVYNRALSASEIAGLMRAGAVQIGASSADLDAGSSLEQGLGGHWTMDGTDTLSTITDRSGNSNHGYFYGGATSSAKTIGILGQALNLDGATQVRGVPGSELLSGEGSVAAWVKPDIDENASWTIYASWAASDRYFTFGLNNIENTDIFISGREAAVSEDAYATVPSLYDGDWHHVVATVSGSGSALYVDGVAQSLSGSNTIFTGDAVSHTTWRIGAFDIGDGDCCFFQGGIDDVRVYDRVLTPAEAKQLYDLGRVRME